MAGSMRAIRSEQSSPLPPIRKMAQEFLTTPVYGETVPTAMMSEANETSEQKALRMAENMMLLLEDCRDHMRNMAEQLRHKSREINELKFYKKAHQELKLQETCHRAEIKDLRVRVKELENCLERPSSLGSEHMSQTKEKEEEIPVPLPPSGKARPGGRRPYMGNMRIEQGNLPDISGNKERISPSTLAGSPPCDKQSCSVSRPPPDRSSRLPMPVVCPVSPSTPQNAQYKIRTPEPQPSLLPACMDVNSLVTDLEFDPRSLHEKSSHVTDHG